MNDGGDVVDQIGEEWLPVSNGLTMGTTEGHCVHGMWVRHEAATHKDKSEGEAKDLKLGKFNHNLRLITQSTPSYKGLTELSLKIFKN